MMHFENSISERSILNIRNKNKNYLNIIRCLRKIKNSNLYKTIVTSGIVVSSHLLLLSIFEPIFYFSYVINIESNAMLSELDGYINYAVNIYNKEFSEELKYQIYTKLNLLYNTYDYIIDQNIVESKKKNLKIEEKLKITAAYYSLSIGLILLLLILCSLPIFNKIKWKIIILENMMMILIFGLYEYLFFKNVVMKYDPVTDEDLNEYLLDTLREDINIIQ